MNIAEFKRLYGTTPNAELATMFDLSEEEVEGLAKRLALGKSRKVFRVERMPRWETEEIDRLRSLFPDASNEAIALLLNRTVKAIVAKAHQLGLRKHPTRLTAMGRENISKRSF